jgi:hypothetical protein
MQEQSKKIDIFFVQKFDIVHLFRGALYWHELEQFNSKSATPLHGQKSFIE